MSPAFSRRSSSTEPKRNSPSQGIEQSRFLEPISPDQFFIQRAHLAELARVADNLIASVDASAENAAAFFRVGRDETKVSPGLILDMFLQLV